MNEQVAPTSTYGILLAIHRVGVSYRLQAVCDSSARATVSNHVRKSSSRISRRLLTRTVLNRREGSGSFTALRKKLLLSPVAAAASSNPSAIRISDRFVFSLIIDCLTLKNIDS